MADNSERVQDYARWALAGIRLFNGAAALLAPSWLIRRLGVDPQQSPATSYVFRMFGIRTVLIGVELLQPDPVRRDRAVRMGVLIHASDTLGAALAGIQGHLSPRAAVTTTLISAVNTVLAIIAWPRES